MSLLYYGSGRLNKYGSGWDRQKVERPDGAKLILELSEVDHTGAPIRMSTSLNC